MKQQSCVSVVSLLSLFKCHKFTKYFSADIFSCCVYFSRRVSCLESRARLTEVSPLLVSPGRVSRYRPSRPAPSYTAICGD